MEKKRKVRINGKLVTNDDWKPTLGKSERPDILWRELFGVGTPHPLDKVFERA